MTGMETLISLGTTAAIGVSTFVALKLVPLEKADTTLEKADDALHKRIDALRDDAKSEREKMDSRIQAIEKTYIDRAEFNRVMESLFSKMDRNTERVENVMRDLGMKVDHLSERVGKVEKDS